MSDLVLDAHGARLAVGNRVRVAGSEGEPTGPWLGAVRSISDFDCDHDGEQYVPQYPDVTVAFDDGEVERFSTSPDARKAYLSDVFEYTCEEIEREP